MEPHLGVPKLHLTRLARAARMRPNDLGNGSNPAPGAAGRVRAGRQRGHRAEPIPPGTGWVPTLGARRARRQ
jgi:hypothetical protein